MNKKIEYYAEKGVKALKRLEEIRKSIKAANISYSEIAELQGLAKYIDKNDTELLEWSGVKEKCEYCGIYPCSEHARD